MGDFLEIYRAFYGKVFTFVLSLVRSKANAQDITQNIFMKLWKNRKKLEHIKSMDDYLFILSKNACMDYFRKASRKKEISTYVFDEFLLSRIVSSPEKRIDALSDIEELRHVIDSLPSKRRDIFIMSRFDGLSNDEIASILGVSKKTVENQISLATKKNKNFQLEVGCFFRQFRL